MLRKAVIAGHLVKHRQAWVEGTMAPGHACEAQMKFKAPARRFGRLVIWKGGHSIIPLTSLRGLCLDIPENGLHVWIMNTLGTFLEHSGGDVLWKQHQLNRVGPECADSECLVHIFGSLWAAMFCGGNIDAIGSL